jgi:hypothetical protein
MNPVTAPNAISARCLQLVVPLNLPLSFVTAARASDHGKEMPLLVPFALLSLVPLPLIEPRYTIVAFSLFWHSGRLPLGYPT